MVLARRLLIAAAVLLVAVVAYEFWIAFQTSRDLQNARDAVTRFETALDEDDTAARTDALADLAEATSSARSRTDGPWWGAVTLLPMVGDDAGGVRDLAESLDVLSREGTPPLVAALDQLDEVAVDGGVDLDVVRGLGDSINDAESALSRAEEIVALRSTGGFVDALRTRYSDYVEEISNLASGMRVASTAVEVLPQMLGADEQRQYLLAFQNNAEIRATGGLIGSWALLDAEDGRLELARQGAGSRDFPALRDPVLPLTDEEKVLFDLQLGRFFINANLTPDFPRAAELLNAHWEQSYPEELDGVVSLDTVSLAYLLEGTGPVTVDGITLTRENAVAELLNGTYLREEDPAKQDEFFERAAKAIFSAVTDGLASPRAFVEGLGRAGREGRLLIAPFDDADAQALAGTAVLGAMTEAADTPRVDIAFNDATGAKMSYYLRYENNTDVTSCAGGSLNIEGSLNLRQTMSASELAALPDYITGGGNFGTDPGEQFVFTYLTAPAGSTFERVSIDGQKIEDLYVDTLDGRPVVALYLLISQTSDTLVNYTISAPREADTEALRVHLTPSVAPGRSTQVIDSPCS